MTEQYLPWSPSVGVFREPLDASLELVDCKAECDWNNGNAFLGATDWRPARLYTPDEIAAFWADRERLDWLINTERADLGFDSVSYRSAIDQAMKGGE